MSASSGLSATAEAGAVVVARLPQAMALVAVAEARWRGHVFLLMLYPQH